MVIKDNRLEADGIYYYIYSKKVKRVQTSENKLVD